MVSVVSGSSMYVCKTTCGKGIKVSTDYIPKVNPSHSKPSEVHQSTCSCFEVVPPFGRERALTSHRERLGR